MSECNYLEESEKNALLGFHFFTGNDYIRQSFEMERKAVGQL